MHTECIQYSICTLYVVYTCTLYTYMYMYISTCTLSSPARRGEGPWFCCEDQSHQLDDSQLDDRHAPVQRKRNSKSRLIRGEPEQPPNTRVTYGEFAIPMYVCIYACMYVVIRRPRASVLPRPFQHSGPPMPSTALFLWCGNQNDWCGHKPRPPARPSIYPGENPACS